MGCVFSLFFVCFLFVFCCCESWAWFSVGRDFSLWVLWCVRGFKLVVREGFCCFVCLYLACGFLSSQPWLGCAGVAKQEASQATAKCRETNVNWFTLAFARDISLAKAWIKCRKWCWKRQRRGSKSKGNSSVRVRPVQCGNASACHACIAGSNPFISVNITLLQKNKFLNKTFVQNSICEKMQKNEILNKKQNVPLECCDAPPAHKYFAKSCWTCT